MLSSAGSGKINSSEAFSPVVKFSIQNQFMAPGVPWVSETSLMLRSSQSTDLKRAREVLGWCQFLEKMSFNEIQDLIPAADTLSIQLKYGLEPSAKLVQFLRSFTAETFPLDLEASIDNESIVEIDVSYGGADGPDLKILAEMTGLSESELIARHSSATYIVAFMGFAPGFGYLIGLPKELSMPRRQEPRTHVPQGSVAIGGSFTGIYPQDLPGGWNIIGRTDQIMWDLALNPPTLLLPGRKIRFRSI